MGSKNSLVTVKDLQGREEPNMKALSLIKDMRRALCL